MREIRIMARGVLCAVLVGAAYAQQGPREGRRSGARAPREMAADKRMSVAPIGDVPAGERTDDTPVSPAAERSAAETTTIRDCSNSSCGAMMSN